MTDPHSYADVPEDVQEDERFRTAKADNDRAAAKRLEHARKMLEAARDPERRRRAVNEAKRPVMVSVAPASGKIRRNGPCPCGSRKKFKTCCLDKVKSGELEPVKHSRKKK